MSDDDDRTLDDLRQALAGAGAEQVGQDRVTTISRAAFSWRARDAELALLVYDSSVDGVGAVRASPAGGDDRSRTLSFQGAALVVDVELNRSAVNGQLVPATAAEVTLVTVDGPFASTTADDIGCFVLPRPPDGPVRIECVAGGRRTATQWVVLRAP